MFRNILFTMSLSGSIIVLLYLLFYPLAQRYFPLVWRYQLLKIAIFFYLIPIAECKYYVFNILKALFPSLWNKIHIVREFNAIYSISTEGGFIRLSPNVYKIIFILSICGIISSLIFSRSIIQNQKIKKLYKTGSNKFADQKLQEIFSKTKKELNIKKQINFVFSEYCQSPVTCGIISPVVWFPVYRKNKPNEKLFKYIVKHELLHIKRNDILIKYLGLLVMAIHWFNPFSYFLYHELSSIGEIYCDNGVLEGQGKDEYKEYGELLLQTAIKKNVDTGYSFFIGIADKGHQKIIKRRIIEMKMENKNKTIFSIMTMIFICIIGGITAFAYEPPYKIRGDNGDNFTFDREFIEENTETIPWNQYFIEYTGKTSQIQKQDFSERAGCIHNYIEGTLRDHIKNSSGGCTIREYDALKCSLCNSVIKGDITNVITYQKCPH